MMPWACLASEIRHFIAGVRVPPASGVYLPFYNPATGAVLGQVAAGNAEDVARAVAAAQQAQEAWSLMPAPERARYLEAIARGIEARLEALAEAFKGKSQCRLLACFLRTILILRVPLERLQG